jgi:hypothetical protein
MDKTFIALGDARVRLLIFTAAERYRISDDGWFSEICDLKAS